jgi:hypothetical protein
MAHLNKDTAAEAVSFVANDINKIFEGIQEIHYLWTAPIEAGAILTILAVLVKVYALPGWGVIFIVLRSLKKYTKVLNVEGREFVK